MDVNKKKQKRSPMKKIGAEAYAIVAQIVVVIGDILCCFGAAAGAANY